VLYPSLSVQKMHICSLKQKLLLSINFSGIIYCNTSSEAPSRIISNFINMLFNLVHILECHCGVFRCAECHYAESRGTEKRATLNAENLNKSSWLFLPGLHVIKLYACEHKFQVFAWILLKNAIASCKQRNCAMDNKIARP
jgi:hypothetical protein